MERPIYRWRGGEVEQFLNIPKIYKGENLMKEMNGKKNYNIIISMIKVLIRITGVENIIVFNNQFYSSLRHKLSDNLSTIYNNCSQKMDFVKDGGYVRVELLKDNGDGFSRMY